MRDSNVDRFFLGWEWQHKWWTHFGRPLDCKLVLVTARDDSGSLLGIAPLFARISSARRLGQAVQLAPIGNVWRMDGGEVTEHVDWIVRREFEDTVPAAIGDYLIDGLDWDEMLISYTSPQSLSSRTLTVVAEKTQCYMRGEKLLRHYSIDTTGTFEEFVSSLGPNTRRRLCTRRTVLNQLGNVDLVFADEGNLGSQLDKLESLSRKRWDTGFPPIVRGFYEDLSRDLLSDGRLRFSTLEVGGRPISALFDVEVDGIEYNIRSAIDTAFDRRVSPGLLHLGYAIEDACRRKHVARYALLAGAGKHTDFKRHIARIVDDFTSIQLVRRPHEKLLYRLYDRLTRGTD